MDATGASRSSGPQAHGAHQPAELHGAACTAGVKPTRWSGIHSTGNSAIQAQFGTYFVNACNVALGCAYARQRVIASLCTVQFFVYVPKVGDRLRHLRELDPPQPRNGHKGCHGCLFHVCHLWGKDKTSYVAGYPSNKKTTAWCAGMKAVRVNNPSACAY